ncbi:MAG: hypothetical protein KBC64_06530 [Simkaniaceae bacterium]|nr:hypothetical protein [Simkaniaceae bacterium]
MAKAFSAHELSCFRRRNSGDIKQGISRKFIWKGSSEAMKVICKHIEHKKLHFERVIKGALKLFFEKGIPLEIGPKITFTPV